MTVLERPLFGNVQIHRLTTVPGSDRTEFISNVTLLSIRRGGSRSGLGIKTDVGLCTFTLHNDEDPMNGGTLDIGQEIQIVAGADIKHTDEEIYSEDFTSDVGGWIAERGPADQVPLASVDGALVLESVANASHAGATVNLSGLIPGVTYQITLSIRANAQTWTYITSDYVDDHGQWFEEAGSTTVVYDLTADADTAYIFVQAGNDPTPSPVHLEIDWVTVTGTWTEYSLQPIFTGKVADITSGYPLVKATGEERTTVQVTVADAVAIHSTTPRYGVQIVEGFETFESRINRLSGSALAPIEAPVQGAPREVYSF